MDFANINGQLLRRSEATLHISDLGLRRGYGAFEFFRVHDGIPVFVEDHLRRFERSARLIELEVPYTLAELEGFVRQLIEVNRVGSAGIQLVLTGGYSDDLFTPSAPNLIIDPVAIRPQPAELYEKGSKIILHRNVREAPEAKTTAYVTAVALSKRVKAEGATEVVYHDGLHVTEGGRSSLCFVKNGVLVTARDGVLPGITRIHALNLAERFMPVEHRAFTLDELFAADEVILTGSTRGVMPVVRVEDRAVGDGRVGPHTHRLMDAFKQHVAEYLATRQQVPR